MPAPFPSRCCHALGNDADILSCDFWGWWPVIGSYDTIVENLQLVSLDSSNLASKAAVRRLKPIVEERREKMKEEMIGELWKISIYHTDLEPLQF